MFVNVPLSNKILSLNYYYTIHEKDFSRKEAKYIEDIFSRRSGAMKTIAEIVGVGATERLRKESEKDGKH